MTIPEDTTKLAERLNRSAKYLREAGAAPIVNTALPASGEAGAEPGRVVRSAQWAAFTQVLDFINTLETKDVPKKEIYAAVMEMRPASHDDILADLADFDAVRRGLADCRACLEEAEANASPSIPAIEDGYVLVPRVEIDRVKNTLSEIAYGGTPWLDMANANLSIRQIEAMLAASPPRKEPGQ